MNLEELLANIIISINRFFKNSFYYENQEEENEKRKTK